MKKPMIYILIAVLLLLLAGCTTEQAVTDPQPKGGTVYIKVNPEIAVTYDGNGNVLAVTAVTADASDIVDSYQDFIGKDCAKVVTELVTKIGEAGYLSESSGDVTIAISVLEEAEAPSPSFVDTVVQQVQAVVEQNQWQGTVQVEAVSPTDATTEPFTEPSTKPSTGPARPDNVPEDAQEQADGTFVLTVYTDASGKPLTEDDPGAVFIQVTTYDAAGSLLSDSILFRDGTAQSLTTYSQDGIQASITTWQEDGIMRYYEEFFPNGKCKLWKRWRSDGSLDQEYAAYHDRDADNGIITVYDASGNLLSRSTIGNPDGSPNTDEMWEADGTHIVFTIVDGNAVGERYDYPDGGFLSVTYDYEADTMHAVRQRFDDSHDIISRISDGEYIEGYFESIIDGHRTRIEYRDGYKYKEIHDGVTNPLGYSYRQTTVFYSNGQSMYSERYFYADGGRLYAEYDENGNMVFSEDTTDCNYAEIG